MAPINMSTDTSVHGLFSLLRESLEAATLALPSEESVAPPGDGISLFDVKNELLLSYLHNLVFLILLKIRQASGASTSPAGHSNLGDEVVKQLVELRVYLEKGVAPLEGRLKYQIDKVIRAADDDTRSAAQKQMDTAGKRNTNQRRKKRDRNDDLSDSASEASEDSEDSEDSAEIDDLSYRPNPAAFVRPASANTKQTSASALEGNGIYKPPRIAATTMPTTSRKEGREARRPQKSAVLEEYIASELSTAPVAEPSIGSTIVSGGRTTKTHKDREKDAERQEYEEANFMRLPKESKKERAKKGVRERGGFGGEEWRDIDAGIGRIDRLTTKKGGRASQLASSRKRAVEDGPRDSGARAGELLAKRRRMDAQKRHR